MKPKIYLLVLLPFAFIINASFTYDEPCIEIKDRQNLPTDIYRILKPENAILIGEVHGTNESAQFVEGMVNLWLASGEKVLLGLEINQDYQETIDNFMQTGNFDLIKNMPFFNREPQLQDGRSSVAMANLIKSLYKKNNLKIVCLDMPSSIKYHQKRDSIMGANAIAALNTNTNWKLISLTGNVHNKTELGGFGYPMGYWMLNSRELKLSKENVASVDIVYEAGSSWNCRGVNGTSVCKEFRQGNLSGDLASKYPYENFFTNNGKEMFLFTRKISTSPPLAQ